MTVTVIVLVQPDELVAVITAVAGLVLPVTTPVTTPVEEPTVATPVDPELHVVPADVNVVVAPWHSVAVPVIAGGNAFTVTVVVVAQPAELV